MYILKCLLYSMIVFASVQIGRVIASRYTNRYQELKECKVALSMLQNQMEYTMKPVSEIFQEIGKKVKHPIAMLFQKAALYMGENSAAQAWEHSIEEVGTNLSKEDKAILKDLGNVLGKTDLEGQVKGMQLVQAFLDNQIQDALVEQKKNGKLYKTLGVVGGITIVILLV